MRFLKEVWLAIRGLGRAPAYALAFIVTLGLGIGVNTAIFSVIDGVLLEPLPYNDSDRLMYIRQPATLAGVDNTSFSFLEVDDYRGQSRTLDEIVEYGDWTFSVVGMGDPHRAIGGLVTANYFDVLGIRAQLGRTLQAADDGEGVEPVAVLTQEYWQRAFGADPDILGKTVKLSGKTTTIVGVLEPGTHYTGTRRQDLFVNYATNDHYQGATMQDDRTHRMTDIFARLAPGATVESARAEIEGINARVRRDHPETYPERLGFGIFLTSWQNELTKDARPTLLILMGTVGLVLLLACANVANLSLTRLIIKEREMAIRTAMGAGRGRIRMAMLAENLVLSMAGAGLGLVLSFVGLDMLVTYANRFTVRTGEIGIDFTVLAFTIAVGVGIAMLLAWAPSLPFNRDLSGALSAAGGGRSTGSLSRKRLQRGLVVSQLALSFTLLIGAGLLIRSLVNLQRVDAGLDVEDVVTLESPNFTGMDLEEQRVLFESVVQRVRHYPGVKAAAYASRTPFQTDPPQPRTFRVEGREEPGAQTPMGAFNTVSTDYFETVGVPILRGRGFTRDDLADSDSVVVINQAMANAYFPGEEAVGQRIGWQSFGGNWSPYQRVVGVVADSRDFGLQQAGFHAVFQPASQSFPGPAFLIRTTGEAGPLAKHVADVIHETDPERPVDRVQTLEQLRAESIAPQRLNATLFGVFALLALVIAGVGVLGVLGFSVSQRVHEFGVRLALGAQQDQVLGLVLREGVLLALAALVVGGVAAVGLSRFLAGLLFEVEPTDPVTFVGVGVILGLVAVAASLIPARRATRVDPMVALRSD